MSYQPLSPPSAVTPVAAPPKPPSRVLLWIGVAVLLAGLVLASVLYLLSGSASEESAKKLARAPVGCTTTLQFERAGTFLIFIETKGATSDVAGDCSAGEQTYDSTGSTPELTLTLVDGDDNELDLDDNSNVSYDAGGFAGTSVNQVTIDEAGTYRLTVESPDDQFAVAVGSDPNEAADSMTTLALVAALIGVVVGLVLIVLGRRRPALPPPPAATPWQQQTQAQPTWQVHPTIPPQGALTQPVWAPQPTPQSPSRPPEANDPFGRPPQTS